MVRIPLLEYAENKLAQHRSAQRERLFFIEFCLWFLGELRRKDLVEHFEISEPAATKDLALYAELNPDALTYDFRQKHYRQVSGGVPLFEHNVDQSLYALAGNQAISQSVDYLARVTSVIGQSIKRKLQLDVVSTITQCIHQNRRMNAVYRSMSRGELTRRLTPLALIHDGLRWHVRCFDEDDGQYKDHNLARFNQSEQLDTSPADLEDDPAWTRWVELELVPHPKSEHPETIELDYGMDASSKTVRLRSCIVGYFLRRWPIDYTDNASDDPRHHQLYLSNKRQLIDAGVPNWAFLSPHQQRDT